MDDERLHARRTALKCLGFGGAGTLFALAGGVLTPIDLAMAASDDALRRAELKPLFVQISDSHIGFSKDANPDVVATLNRGIDLVNTAYNYLDLVPKGRDEGDRGPFWVRRHDEYEQP